MRSDCETVPKPFTKADADKAEVMEAQLATASTSRAAAVTAGCQVYWPAPYEVCGVIRDKYNQLGGPNSFLTYPKTNELTNPDRVGKRSEFLGGNIYWHPSVGARPVAHDFLTKFGEKGYESGYLKYPTTDEIILSDGTSRRQEFQGGSMYFSFQPGVGTHVIQGNIRDYWRGLGAEASQLGFPITDELQIGDKFYSKFQGGTVYWSAASGIEVAYAPANYFRRDASGEPCDPVIDTDGSCGINFNYAEIQTKLTRCISGVATPTEIVFGIVGSSKFPNPLPVTCGQYRHIDQDHDIEEDRERGLQCIGLTYSMGMQKPKSEITTKKYDGINWYNSKNLNMRNVILYDPTYNDDYRHTNTLITAWAGNGDGNDWGGCVRGYMN